MIKLDILMKTIIGITGGIASGKSTITNFLRKNQYEVIDADEISHNSLKKDGKAYQAVIDYFSEVILCDNQEINRQKLGEIVFSNKEKLSKLNQIIHPIVYKEIENRLLDCNGVVFIDVPLLFETGFNKLCDYTVVIAVDLDEQIKRLRNRDGLSLSEAKARINAQMPLELKKEKASFVIDNNSSVDNTIEQLNKLLERIRNKNNGKII